jgi:hypothetical protein
MSDNRAPKVKGDRVGPFLLDERLGEGGNAEVWRASGQGGLQVALKILHTRFQQADNPRFLRFRDEILTHSSLTGEPGVLPVIAKHLPNTPNERDPAWLATDLATPLKRALGMEADLTEIVDAVASFARTLTRLHARGISHRDIKPNNLYRHDSEWVLGDFGLVSFPDKDAITGTGEKLGPAHFLAPEMLDNAKMADGCAADVYSLMKTLWVLASGQNFPPGGELRIDNAQTTVAGYRAHARVHFLDRLIERGTRHRAADRPSMAEIVSELDAWLFPEPRSQGSADVSDLANRIAALSAPVLRAEERRQWRVDNAKAAFQQLATHLEPIGKQVADAIQVNRLTYGSDGNTQQYMVGEVRFLANADWAEDLRFAVLGPGSRPSGLYGAVCASITPDDILHVMVGYALDPEGRGRRDTIWSDVRHVPAGSAGQDKVVTELLAGLTTNLRKLLESYLQLLEVKQFGE